MYEKSYLNHCNPIVLMSFLVVAMFWGMVLTHPIFLFVSVACSFVTAFLLEKNTFRKLKFRIPVMLTIVIINPLFNPRGDTVLFTYFGRAYTFEALLYGLVLAMIFFTISNWFLCYNALISSDKFLYLFGGIFPSVSLLISMILKFIPQYEQKLHSVLAARNSVGKSLDCETKREKIENVSTVLSALMSIALEGSLTTVDSMRSRGYGLSGRTRFLSYKFRKFDIVSEILILTFSVFMFIVWIRGAASAEFLPSIKISWGSLEFYIGIMVYFILLIMPAVYIVFEEVKWNILESKI